MLLIKMPPVAVCATRLAVVVGRGLALLPMPLEACRARLVGSMAPVPVALMAPPLNSSRVL